MSTQLTPSSPAREPARDSAGLDLATLRQRRTLKWTAHAQDVLPLWVAEMDFATAPPVLSALLSAVKDESLGYPPREDHSGVREATVDWIATTTGWTVDPTLVHTVPDVVRGLHLALDTYSEPQSPIVVLLPAYHPFFEVVRTLGRGRLDIPMAWDGQRHTLDLDAIEAALRPGGRSLILCNPHNPLGRAFSRDELLELSRIVARHDARVVSDEIHAPLTHPGHEHVPYASVSPQAADHAITLMSASKGWNLAGLNCAQVILSNAADEDRWQEVSPIYTHGASTLGLMATVAAYREGGDWREEVRQRLADNQNLVHELVAHHLPDVRHHLAEATYFAWLDCRELGLTEAPSDFFLTHSKVALSAGERFGPAYRDHARLNFATTPAMLEQAITTMGAAVRRRPT